MLSNSTLEKLQSFKMPGFVDTLLQQYQNPHYCDLSFDERLTLLIDFEFTRRSDVSAKRRLKDSRLLGCASIEDIDFSIQRGISKSLILELAQGTWLSTAKNLIITGPTGVGKTFLASAIARNICMLGTNIRLHRANLLISNLLAYEQRGSLQQAIANLCRAKLLILDEWLLDQILTHQARLLLDLFDIRYRRYSCMFISQLPIPSWHPQFEDPTLADAILDRLVHNSIRVELSGDSVRKLKPNLPTLQEVPPQNTFIL